MQASLSNIVDHMHPINTNTSILQHTADSTTNTNILEYMDDTTMDSSIQGYIADTSTIDDTTTNTSIDTLTTPSYTASSIDNPWLQDIPEYVDARMNYTPDPICEVVMDGSFHLAEFMLDAGVSVNQSDPFGDTLLHLASQGGHDNVVQLLLQRGATLDRKNDDGETPLISATRNHHNATIKLLLNAGAAIDIKNKCGETALIVATKSGNNALVAMLLHYNANIHITDKLGMSPLHHASQLSLDIVMLLLLQCADITLKNHEGKTAENLAASSNNMEILEYLCEQARLAPIKRRLAYQWLKNTSMKQTCNNTK